MSGSSGSKETLQATGPTTRKTTEMKTYCLKCGKPSNTSRCPECEIKYRPRTYPSRSSTARGYDSNWTKLSKRARKLQPFCSDCGTSYDLQADHKPIAWQRKEQGLPIRLQDIDVVCGKCNRRRGAARGPSMRSEPKTP